MCTCNYFSSNYISDIFIDTEITRVKFVHNFAEKYLTVHSVAGRCKYM